METQQNECETVWQKYEQFFLNFIKEKEQKSKQLKKEEKEND